MTYKCYKYNPQCTFHIQSQKHKYEVTNPLSQHSTSYQSVSRWKAVLNRRSVPRRESISSQNLLTNRGSRSEMITSGIPCNLNTWLTNKQAYSVAVISLVQRKKCTILVRRSTKTATVVLPSDSHKSVTRSVVICYQARSHRGIGCKAPAFFRLSDFIR